MADALDRSASPPKRRVSWLALSPLIIFLALGGVFSYQLLFGGPTAEVPSALIGRSAPEMTLPAIEGSNVPGFTTADLSGQVSIVNVWASWCAPCRDEHPMLMELSRDERLQLVGINKEDAPSDANRFLRTLGNPFDRIGTDRSGRNSIEWGVYGVPETFIVGQDGTILHKHIGPFTSADVATTFLPILEAALADPTWRP